MYVSSNELYQESGRDICSDACWKPVYCLCCSAVVGRRFGRSQKKAEVIVGFSCCVEDPMAARLRANGVIVVSLRLSIVSQVLLDGQKNEKRLVSLFWIIRSKFVLFAALEPRQKLSAYTHPLHSGRSSRTEASCSSNNNSNKMGEPSVPDRREYAILQTTTAAAETDPLTSDSDNDEDRYQDEELGGDLVVEEEDGDGDVDVGNSASTSPSLTGTISTPAAEAPVPTSSARPVLHVIAPATLPEGYVFEAVTMIPQGVYGENHNTTVMTTKVTVPPGGVEEGQSFEVPFPRHVLEQAPFTCEQRKRRKRTTQQIPVGHWRDGPLDVFEYGVFHPSA